MVFSSITFLLYFLPLFLLIYLISPNKFKNIVILSFSIFFYAWGAPKFLFLLLFSTIIDYYLVQKIQEEQTQVRKKLFLVLSLFLNVGLLIYFKYSNFFIENLNFILDKTGSQTISWVNVILPIGISFYTFQTLTYSIDVYRGIHKPFNKLSNYLVYILSFPQMIAGPIVKFNEIVDQIENRKDNYKDKIHGFFRFSVGLAKKVLIANVLGEAADQIFNTSFDQLNMVSAWVGIIAYTFQIYFDFSGYSDMAIGLGKLMGFKFPENFNNPYISKNISEFWQRWHMTLGQWMKTYLYIPLGGNRTKKVSRVYFNLIVVFLISGLWHGASWNFIIWGAFHGIFLILDRLFLIKLLSKFHYSIQILFTFFIVLIGWVFFRIEELDKAIEFISILFQFSGNLANQDLFDIRFYSILIIAILFSFKSVFNKGIQLDNLIYYPTSDKIKINSLYIFISLLLFIISVSAITTKGFNPFIYFRF